MRLSKERRRSNLKSHLDEHPFLTDEELSDYFGVSIQTIRLDRSVLGIPDVRERTRLLAEKNYSSVRAIGSGEIVGELLELDLGHSATSLLTTDESMVFSKTNLVRSHFIFAQADSLALAVIDSDHAVTELSNAKFKSPVTAGERLLARAHIIRSRAADESVVLVEIAAGERKVFRGKFVVATDGALKESGVIA
ncbi:MAG: transcription factor FapR [Bacillota bacterium]